MMENENKNLPTEENEEEMIYTLQDENGEEYDFALIATTEYKGVNYYAMVPADETDDNEFLEYTILKGVMENGEESLVSIDDDDEFEDVAAIFDNMFSEEIDYDAK